MGVIHNFEKIPYMLDTKFIHFREFEILGGLGEEVTPPQRGGGGSMHCVAVFHNSNYKTPILTEKIHCTTICAAGDISSRATIALTWGCILLYFLAAEKLP